MTTFTIRRIVLDQLYPKERESLVRRSPVPSVDIRRQAAEIVDRIRTGGDQALRSANVEYGGGRRMGRLEVTTEEMHAALGALPPKLRDALETAAANIRAVHERQRPVDDRAEPTPGVVVERRWAPLRRVGVYVPGGRAAYPSSLLMGVIPAKIAGVAEVAVTSPAGPEGELDPTMLAAAALVGVDELWATGGAQAIGALAYGTQSIRPVDKIVGPGNAWMTAAKMAVFGDVAIDLPAGPSEAVVVADTTASPRVVAADLLCQAEHGKESPVLLVTDSVALADAVETELQTMIGNLMRAPVLRAALGEHGAIVIAENREEALRFADEYAPEHLSLHVADAATAVDAVPSAGSVFVGHWSPESAGDYATGANHVLPTGGLARSHGPLAVEDFGSWRQVQELTRDGLAALRPTITALAEAEGLTAHRYCVDVRFEDPAS